MMSIPVLMMAAGNWFGTMPEASLTYTHAGKKVFFLLHHECVSWWKISGYYEEFIMLDFNMFKWEKIKNGKEY